MNRKNNLAMRTIKTIFLTGFLIIYSIVCLGQQESLVKYARFEYNGKTQYGIVEGKSVNLIKGDLFGDWSKTKKIIPLSDVKLLAPSEPSKVIAMAFNYLSHTVDRPKPEKPLAFAKLPTCIIGPDEQIIKPVDSHNLHYEGELVVIISKKASNIKQEEVKNYILGVTIGNDISERDWQKQEAQWLRAKASDTFGPMGPWIVSGLNYNDLHLETSLNGTVVQSQRTKDMFFNVEECISYLSKYITFYPGDAIFMGTPGITTKMSVGDKVEVEIEGIGILSNTVIEK